MGIRYRRFIQPVSATTEEPFDPPLTTVEGPAEIPTARKPATTVPITRIAMVRFVVFMASSSSSQSGLSDLPSDTSVRQEEGGGYR